MMKIDYSPFKEAAAHTNLAIWAEQLYKLSQNIVDDCNHGHWDMWMEAINELPKINLS